METPPPINTPAPATTTPVTSVVPDGNDKLWSILSHLSALLGVGFVLPLVVYLVKKDESEYVAKNAREALNFHISVLIYLLCCIPLCFVIIGFPLFFAVAIASLVLAIIAAVNASNGTVYHYPLTIRLVS